MASALSSAQTQPLMTRHVRDVTLNGQARLVGQLPATQSMSLDVVLPVSDPAGLESFLQGVYDPNSPSYRHFLTVQEFSAMFGPSQADYDNLTKFMKASGFTVVGGSRDAMDVRIQGSVANVESAFHVSMGVYQHPTENRTFYAPDREPTVNLQTPLWHISGLDNYSIPHPLLEHTVLTGKSSNATTGSGPSASYLGSDMRAAYYGGTALTGSGQNIGLLEYYGYDIDDLNTYYADAGQTLTATITGVSTDGTSLACLDANGCDDTEQIIDMTQALGMAPGINTLYVYVGSSDTAILGAMTTANPLPLQLSSSWVWIPADPATDDPYFQRMAAQGQSFFQAAGDSGAWTPSQYLYPSEDGNVICVGGTSLTTTSAAGAWSSEVGWVDGGGGISPDQLPIPSWQQIPGVINSGNDGSTQYRNGPDVSANADFTFYVCADQAGCTANVYGGTSFAAPMWAGYVALANQQAVAQGTPAVGFLNPIIYPIGVSSSYDEDFHDITSGNNGFLAVAGYDLDSGWGSPNGTNLINALTSPTLVISLPTTVTVQRGYTGTPTISSTIWGGFNAAVALTAIGQPAGVTVSFSPASIAAPGSGSSTMNIAVASTTALGTYPITISGTGGGITQTSAISLVVSGPATHFAVSAPASAYFGVPLTFQVTAEDPSNNTSTGYSGTVHFTSSDPQAVLPGNITLTNGTGTFSATLYTGGLQTIAATDTVTSTIAGTSANISVIGIPTHFGLMVPVNTPAGSPFTFYVEAQDQYGVTAPGYSGTIHFTSSDPQAALPANAGLVNGVGAFYATLNTAGTQTIIASDTVNASITGSGSIAVFRLAAVPTFLPAPIGTFTTPQSVTLADASPGVTIYYTTNGSTPTTSSTTYNGPFTVSTTTTINAIAAGNGYAAGPVAIGTYNIVAATPTFSPAPIGTFTTPQSVTLTDASPGATIYYTTNGSTPTTASTQYTGPIPVSTTTTINAIAAGNGYAAGPVAVGTYNIVAATPTFLPAPIGTFTTPQSVTLADASPGVTIYYTTNGSTPTTSSTTYNGPFTVSTTTTINAIAAGNGYAAGPVAIGTYNIVAATPTFSPAPIGTFTTSQSVTLTDSTAGAKIYYTTNGSTPTTASTQYTGPIPVSVTTTINAIAAVNGSGTSTVAIGTYTITAATPSFSPAPATYSTSQSVTLTDSTAGAKIYYTTNGSTPTTASTQYTGPIPVSATTTINAIAAVNGSGPSAVAIGTYTIGAATPSFSPAPATYTTPQSVTLTDSTPGAIIYYTTNGSTPTTASTQYTGPIPVSVTTTVNAIAAVNGSGPSAVTSGTYTIVAGPALVESAVSILTTTPASGGSLQVSDTVQNTGAAKAGASDTGFYLSTNGTTKGTYLTYRSVPALGAGASSGPVSTTLTLPTNLTGTYYVIACADYNNAVTESNTNNCTASAPFIVAGAALVESAVSILTSAPISGGSLQVSDTVLNQGGGVAGASDTGFYLSTNGTTKGTYLTYRSVPALGAGTSSGPVSTTLTLPTNLTGTYYVIACADYNNAVTESNTNNCTASAPFTVAGAALVESSVSVLTSAPISGGSLQVSDTVLNQGGGVAGASDTGFYLSTNGTTKGTYLTYRSVPALGAGTSSGPVSTTLTLPTNLTGTYYVIACADYNNAVTESNTNNCTASAPFTVAGADLIENAVSILTTAPALGGAVQVSDTVLNQGAGIAGSSDTAFYLSTNGTTKGAYLGYRSVGSLNPGASSGPVTTTLTLPANTSAGVYYVIACANFNNAVTESNTANNCTASSNTMLVP